ncbi:MAG: metallophosphoesterase [Deltaproteobacteria bacterium]|nr:metallophosphoesterase [Deltaproteobacteria bacterium]
MKLDLSTLFPFLAAATWLAVPLYAAVARGRFYAIFSAILLSFALPGALVLHARLREVVPSLAVVPIDVLFACSMAAAGLQFAHLVRARMRSSAFRWLVSVPGQTFIAGGLLSGPWVLALLPFRWLFGALDWHGALVALTAVEAIPLGLAVASVLTSIGARPETVRIALSREGPKTFGRVPVERVRRRSPIAATVAPSPRRPLRIVQLTDTHLGPWQSVARLRRRVAHLVAREPDLIALTGDYLTMESMGTPGCLVRALEPLAPYADRCVAIFGNHDHEAPEHVRDAMRQLGIRLLIDDEACFATAAGPVQVIGSDYLSEQHAERLAALLGRHPRRADHLRLLLLHDPSGFHALPDDDVDLVLSGHTHGGQVGLVSLGLDWTVLSRTRWPDQGLFARGASRLYVHRGTGFYGFPLRVGVPAEHSLLEIEGH